LSATSVLTAIYMFRVFFLTFYGSFRGTHEQEHHLHESPSTMTIPLIILAVLSTFGGLLGLPAITGSVHLFSSYLREFVSFPYFMNEAEPSSFFEWSLILTSVFVLIICAMFTYRLFAVKQSLVSADEKQQSPLVKIAAGKFYIDELYEMVFVKPLNALGDFLYKVFDLKVIDGLVNAISKWLIAGSGALRRMQTGNVGFYIFAMVFGIIAMLLFNLIIK
jgi:NADH-quinone oxidoreductase subunit L